MKNQLIEANPKMMQMLEVTSKNIKTVIIITIFHIFKKTEERLNMLEIWKI